MTSIQRKVVAIQVLPFTVDGNSILVQFDGPNFDTCGWGVYKRMSDSMASWHEDHLIIQDALDQAVKLAGTFQVPIERLEMMAQWAAEGIVDNRTGDVFKDNPILRQKVQEFSARAPAGEYRVATGFESLDEASGSRKQMFASSEVGKHLIRQPYLIQPLNQIELDDLATRLEKAGHWSNEEKVVPQASVLGVVQEFLREKLETNSIKEQASPLTNMSMPASGEVAE